MLNIRTKIYSNKKKFLSVILNIRVKGITKKNTKKLSSDLVTLRIISILLLTHICIC